MSVLNWTPTKSTTLSIIATWIALAGAVALAVAGSLIPRPVSVEITTDLSYPILITPNWFALAVLTYLCIAAGMAVLVILLRLLYAIRAGEVFVAANVTRLRWISYCGFAIAVISVVAGIVDGMLWAWVAWIAIAIVAAFLALIMRVVKNVIAAACVLQDDSDYTI